MILQNRDPGDHQKHYSNFPADKHPPLPYPPRTNPPSDPPFQPQTLTKSKDWNQKNQKKVE